jgi:hypothetical protein
MTRFPIVAIFAVCVVLCATMTWTPAAFAALHEGSHVAAGVRTTDATIAEALRLGIDLSPTLRRLAERIRRTDGIVYVQEGRCRNRANACLSLSITAAPPYRILFISVNTRCSQQELIRRIGHELTHAMEILADPTVRNFSSAVNLYMRLRQAPRIYWTAFETPAAVEAGALIRAEIQRAQDEALAEDLASGAHGRKPAAAAVEHIK